MIPTNFLRAAKASGLTGFNEQRLKARKSAIHQLISVADEVLPDSDPIMQHIGNVANSAMSSVRMAVPRNGMGVVAVNSEPTMRWTTNTVLQQRLADVEEKER